MSSNYSNDPKITYKAASSSASPQPQRHFRPSIDEESIPWAEIIFEEEPHFAQVPPGTGLPSRSFSTYVESSLDYQIMGPPLAVLAVVLLVFLLLLAAT